MMDFVKELREKIVLERQLFNMVFGLRKLSSKKKTLDEDITRVKHYNYLKNIINNCSQEVEVGEDGLLKEK